MFNELIWRKYPCDLLTDENMAYIESLMPEQYKYAPYMFFITALKKADNDGIFDLEDGAIFARLMRVDDVSIVKLVANGLLQRRIIYREGETSICGFVQWEYAKNERHRTLAERRKLVREKIQEKETNKGAGEMFATGPQQPDRTEAPQSFDVSKNTDSDSSILSCPENDKNTENVAKNFLDDKIQKNVVQKNETQRERKKEEDIESRLETHTQKDKTDERQEREEREATASSGQTEGPPPAVAEETACAADTQETPEIQESQTENDHALNITDTSSTGERELQGKEEFGRTERAQVLKKLEDFFVKNCYGYKKKSGRRSVEQLAERILELADSVNPPDTITDILLKEFLRMHNDKDGYWVNIPVLPQKMLHPNVWAVLMSFAGRILANRQESSKFAQAEAKALEEAKKERGKTDEYLHEEFAKYGIDPEAKDRLTQLFLKKRFETEAQKNEPVQTYDIF